MTDLASTAPHPTPLLTIDDLAAYLAVSPGTVRGWRRGRTGPTAVRVAGSVRWRLADVDAWLDAQRESEDAR